MELNSSLTLLISALVILIFIMTLDDLFIDLCALIFRVRPRPIEKNALLSLPEKKIAIMIANWHEEEVIERMISGNNASIKYANHHFFLGVYPNDSETLSAVRRLEARFANVHAVINSEMGPTSKGQMLNEVVTRIGSFEAKNETPFDLFVIHDSEDIIHPLALSLLNYEAENFDFIQIPIFSLLRNPLALTAGTYMDEFSEMHTKEMLVRNSLGAAIPSAGVGTCINRKLLSYIQRLNDSNLLRPDSLTEDYILGWQSHQGGFRCSFVCRSIATERGSEIIATKEHFPGEFWQSVKQKTRWTIGIAFQAKKILGWSSKIRDNYFLLRDRRGPINSLVTLASLVLLLTTFLSVHLETLHFADWIAALALVNLSGVVVRYVQRVRFYSTVYKSFPVFIVLVRWPIATSINAFAAARAFYQYYLSVFGFRKLTWSKTKHTLPKEFGQTA